MISPLMTPWCTVSAVTSDHLILAWKQVSTLLLSHLSLSHALELVWFVLLSHVTWCQIKQLSSFIWYPGDHKRSEKVWFYQLGLGGRNTVSERGWKLETLGSILAKSGHTQVEPLAVQCSATMHSCMSTVCNHFALVQNCTRVVRSLLVDNCYTCTLYIMTSCALLRGKLMCTAVIT